MGIFRRSRKKEHANPGGPPSLPELSLPHNQSLPNLNLQYGAPTPLPSLAAAGYGKENPGLGLGGARIDPTNGHGRAPSQKQTSVAGAGAGASRPQRSVSSSAGLDQLHSRTSSRATNAGEGGIGGGVDAGSWRQASVSPIRQYHRPYTPQQGSGGLLSSGHPESMQTFSGAMMSPSFSSPQMSTPGIGTPSHLSHQQFGGQQQQHAFPSPSSQSLSGAFTAQRPTSSASGYSAATIPRTFRISPSLHTGIGITGGVTGGAGGASHHSQFGMPGMLHTATLSPDAARRAVDVGRRMSLKKSKAPAKFNLLIVGAQGTGKTTFIKTLLDTLDLSACTPDVRRAIATFGTSAPSSPTIKKYTYTHPLEPERTKKMCMLSDIEIPRTAEMPSLAQIWTENISANAFYASAEGAAAVIEYQGGGAVGGEGGGAAGDESVFHGGGQDAESSLHGFGMGPRSSRSRFSHASTSRSHAGTLFDSNPSKRLVLSITDAPGFSFLPGQEFELERALRKVLRQIEDKFVQSLAEESKVQRRRQADEHYHLVLYFVDPLRVVETEAPPSPARTKMQKEKRASKGSKIAVNGSKGEAGTVNGQGQGQEGLANGTMPASQSDPVGLRRTNSGGALRSRAAEEGSAAAVAERKPKAGVRAATTVGHGPSANDEPASESEGEETQPAASAVGRSFLGMAPSPASITEGLPAANGGEANDEDEEEDEEDFNEIRLRLSQQEKKIILRLSRRANVLPVLAKADLLTEQRSLEIKAAIRLSFQEMGLPAGPFMAAEGPAGELEETEMLSTPTEMTMPALREHRKQGLSISSAITEKSEPDSENDVSSGEPVKRIKLRSRRSFSKPNSERPDVPALDHTPPLFADKQQDEEEPAPPVPLTPKAESNQWPFTLILPEPERPSPPQASRGSDILNGFPAPPKNVPPVPPIPPQHQAHARAESATSYRSSTGSGQDSHTGGAALLNGSSQQGVSGPQIPTLTSTDPGRRFQRRYRWGAIDIFNPEYCDFTALRASILCHHVESLRQSTKVRYEEFRAERLEVRRETLRISVDQRKALLL